MTEKDRAKLLEQFLDDRAATGGGYIEWLEERLHSMQSSLYQIDDMLIVCDMAPPTDGDYKRAVNKLITWNIEVDRYFEQDERNQTPSDYADSF